MNELDMYAVAYYLGFPVPEMGRVRASEIGAEMFMRLLGRARFPAGALEGL